MNWNVSTAVDPAVDYRRAVDALNQGRWRDAQQLALGLTRAVPDHAGVHFVAGVAALQLRDLRTAHEHLQRAVTLNPGRVDYLAQWARLLSSVHAHQQAREAATRALGFETIDTMSLDTLGVVLTQCGDHHGAADAFARAVRQAPGVASMRFNLATALMFLGRIDEAEGEYEACISADPRYWKAYLARSQLRRQTAGRNHVSALQALVQTADATPDAALYLHLSLEKELSDLGEYTSSLLHLQRGKGAWRKTLDYTVERDEALFEAVTSTCGQMVPGEGAQTQEPIFVIGMPRSGTTLVERILSSHSDVTSAGELQNFGVALKRQSGSRTGPLIDVDTLTRAQALDWKALGAQYLDSTRPATGQTPRFIDKLPHNFLYAGHIARALPDARIICLRRDPMDTVLGNFRQLFALGSPYYDYSFDLAETARYYVLFDRLMAFWHTHMPGRILEVHYEEIVRDQTGQTRRLLDHCGLPWQEACLRFEDNQAPVATASVVQVRSPLYATSIGRWRKYGDALDEAANVLRAAGITVQG